MVGDSRLLGCEMKIFKIQRELDISVGGQDNRFTITVRRGLHRAMSSLDKEISQIEQWRNNG
jgi:hypothetical protein